VTVLREKKDRFGRTIGTVMVNGTDACLGQIKAGLAWHYNRYASEQSAQDRADYAAAEDKAKRERSGLWADANPAAPWDWRREK
jgi:endonuclease YncB( thermonuclease family)